MSRFRSLTTRRRTSLAVAAVSALFAGVVVVTIAKDVQTTSSKKKLTGEQLFAVNCARCHSERYGTERTKAEWNTIMMHMRVRANIPASQAREILKYLQENCGTNP